MNKRIKNKQLKQEMKRLFSKKELQFYQKYPRLFSLMPFISLSDLNMWYEEYGKPDINTFQHTVKCIWIYSETSPMEIEDLPKLSYEFDELMNNLYDDKINKLFPNRIRHNILTWKFAIKNS